MKKRKKWPWFIGVLVLVLAVMFATCPKEDRHHEEFAKAFGNNIENINLPFSKQLSGPMKAIVKSATTPNGILNSIAKFLGIDLGIDVTNYGVVSIGRLPNGKIVSVGAFGHIFTMSDDAFCTSIEEWLNQEGMSELAPHIRKDKNK